MEVCPSRAESEVVPHLVPRRVEDGVEDLPFDEPLDIVSMLCQRIWENQMA